MIDTLVCAWRVVGWQMGMSIRNASVRTCFTSLLLLMRTPADQRESQSRVFPAFFIL